MKFNINNKYSALLCGLLVIASSTIQAMESNPQRNLVTPWVQAAVCTAVGRYGPELSKVALSNVTPDYPLVNSLIPSAIKYGGYGLSIHYALNKGIGIPYKNAVTISSLKKAAKNCAKLAPLTICHPEIAEVVSNKASEFAHKYVGNALIGSYAKPTTMAAGVFATAMLINPNLAPAIVCHPEVAKFAADSCNNFLGNYTVPAVIATGALSTLYFVNRNVWKGQLWQKIKRIYEDARPYQFLAPLAVAYHADAIKNYALEYSPFVKGSNLHTDLGIGLKASLYWGGLAGAAYLFITESMGIATQGYIRAKVNELLEKCGVISKKIDEVKSNIEEAQKVTSQILLNQYVQESKLEDFTQKTTDTMQELKTLLENAKSDQSKSHQAFKALQEVNDHIKDNVNSAHDTIKIITDNLSVLKQEYDCIVRYMRDMLKENSSQILGELEKNKNVVEAKIKDIEELAREQSIQLDQVRPKLTALLEVLEEGDQLYHMNQSHILTIKDSLQDIDRVIAELSIHE